MKVKTMIKKLEKMDPEAEVRLHDKSGEWHRRAGCLYGDAGNRN